MRPLHEILAAVRRWRTQRAFAKAWATARTPKHPTPPTDARACINCRRLCVHITTGSIPFCSIDNLPRLPDDTCDDFFAYIPALKGSHNA